MKKITRKELKKELIKIINKDKIEEVIFEPRYNVEDNSFSDYSEYPKRTLVGSTITIRTLFKKEK